MIMGKIQKRRWTEGRREAGREGRGMKEREARKIE